jgi:iron complex transport system substrate-binding protein
VRVVSLLPSATEILFAIGAGEQVVGITHECDFPAEAQHLPRLTSSALPHAGSAGEIDRHVRRSLHAGSSLYYLDAALLEELAPDLIVTQELCAVCAVSYSIVDRAARRLTTDPRIVSLEPSSLEDVYANIVTLGQLTGCEEGAAALVERLRTREKGVRDRVTGRPRPRVVLLEWTDPLMSAGHWTPGLIEAAGGAPILGNAGANSQRIELQAIYDEDPDIIVVAPCGFDLHKTHQAVHALSTSPQWQQLRAVISGCVACVDGNAYVNRPGPRLVDTIEIFAKIFHSC